jgi:hypothetical protein
MMDATDRVAEVVAGLTGCQQMNLAILGEGAREWWAAHDADVPGVVANALVKRGLLERRRDPHVWGRAQYRLTPLGLAVRARLTQEPDNG